MPRQQYRKRKGAQYDTWHFCRNCSQDPKSDYDSQSSRPSGELCNECLAKERNGECTF